jgi:hypothetical protein
MEDEYLHSNLEEELIVTMYKICPKNKNLDYCYIGQTHNFTDRKRQHIRNTICETDKKHYHLKHYETIRNNGGWDEWEIVEIEKILCKTKLEARMREQELIKEYNANLNSVSAFVTEEERKATKNAITTKFKIENKSYVKEYDKQYKEEHKDIIAEQMKKYREENKEKLKEQTKAYREQNKEKCRELQKEWVSKNKDILKEKRKIKTAEQKQQKILEKEQNVEIETDEQKAENEKNKLEKAKKKREQYNENRRLQRLKDKEKINND